VLLWFGLTGVCTGAALYTYFASRVLPAILLAFLLYLLLFRRDALRGRWWGVALLVLIPALMVTPMVSYLRDHPELEQRLGQVSGGLLDAMHTGDLRQAGTVLLDTLAMFSVRGDPEWLYNIPGRPVFDPLTSIAFWAGVGIAVWRWRDPGHAFLLLWLLGGIAPSLLSWPPGSLGHTIVAQPAATALAALGFVRLWRLAARWRRPALRRAARGLVVCALIIAVVVNGYDYFYRWPRYREVRHEYQAPVTAAARYVERHASSQPVAISAPYVDYWNPWSAMNFELYAPELADTVRWFDGRQSLLLPAGSEALIVLPDHLLLPSDLHPDLAAIVEGGAHPIALDRRDALGDELDIYRWVSSLALDRTIASAARGTAWASPETVYLDGASDAQRVPLRFPLDAGGRLALLGYSYAKPTAAPGESWELVTYWQIASADPDPLAIFVHLIDTENVVRAGWDGLYVSSESWGVGDRLVHRHTLVLPEDVPSGPLRIEVGVYSPVTLARLPLQMGSAGDRAPYDRVLLAPIEVR
jgi:hypothetical protein